MNRYTFDFSHLFLKVYKEKDWDADQKLHFLESLKTIAELTEECLIDDIGHDVYKIKLLNYLEKE